MAQFIYTMNRVGKVVPPKRIILRDISLSFFPGAKIGVLGLNGSGKSSLLKIMAGIDKEIEGEARPQPGIKVGFLPQEPQLDETKTVRAVVGEGVGDVQGLIDRFNAISDKFAEEMSEEAMTKLLEEQAQLQDKIDAVGGWELERKLEIAADALRLPPWEAVIQQLSPVAIRSTSDSSWVEPSQLLVATLGNPQGLDLIASGRTDLTEEEALYVDFVVRVDESQAKVVTALHSVVMNAAMGKPFPSALLITRTSGVTPQCSHANRRPVRLRPVCTSSMMSTIPRFSHSRRTAGQNSAGGTWIPPLPCTGSPIRAPTLSPRSSSSLVRA